MQVSKLLRDELAKLATKGQTFEELLWKFVDSPVKQVLEVEKDLDEVEVRNRREEAVVAKAKERLPKLEREAAGISKQLTRIQSEVKALQDPEHIEQRTQKKQVEKGLLEAEQNVSMDIKLRGVEAAAGPAVAETTRRLALVRRAVQNLPRCKDCGTATVLPAGVAQPRFPEVNLQENGWRSKQFAMVLDLECPKCKKRFNFILEKGIDLAKKKLGAGSKIVHGPYNRDQQETEDIEIVLGDPDGEAL